MGKKKNSYICGTEESAVGTFIKALSLAALLAKLV
jgi:hypothetical protein